MKKKFQLFILTFLSNVVLGIEPCPSNEDDKVIVGMRQSSIRIGCNKPTATSFKECNLVKAIGQRRCSNENCYGDRRLTFVGDQRISICQFELTELEQSGMR
jgi:hypothetical protein